MQIHRYDPHLDRERVRDVVDPDALPDAPDSWVDVAEENGQVVGISIGHTPSGPQAELGTIRLRDPARLDILHRFLIIKARHAIEMGYEYATTKIRRRNMVSLAEEFYGVEAKPVGFHVERNRGRVDRTPVEWEVTVHLPTFLDELETMEPPDARNAIPT